jgi:hypothetical protein
MDIYTPRYRWTHIADEVQGWYRELGLEDINTSEVCDWASASSGLPQRRRGGFIGCLPGLDSTSVSMLPAPAEQTQCA